MIAENLRTNEVMNRMIKHSLEKIRSLNLVGWISLSLLRNCFFFSLLFSFFFSEFNSYEKKSLCDNRAGWKIYKARKSGKRGVSELKLLRIQSRRGIAELLTLDFGVLGIQMCVVIWKVRYHQYLSLLIQTAQGSSEDWWKGFRD